MGHATCTTVEVSKLITAAHGLSPFATPGTAAADSRAPFAPWWGEPYVTIDAQLRAVELLTMRAQDAVARDYVERRVARVGGVRDALYDLHRGVAQVHLELHRAAHAPLLAYLDATHEWCREALEGLRRQASHSRDVIVAEARRLAEQSAAFVAECLEPLYRELVAACRVWGASDGEVEAIQLRAAEAHREIVRFRWVTEP